MEPEQISHEIEHQKSIWTSVTPFSKYLAMGLFVAMPFVGGYIGYQFAPERVAEVVVEKVVEVEKVVIKEVERSDYELPFLDFTDCDEQIVSGAAGFHAGETLVVLGETIPDISKCHVLRYEASAFGAGMYSLSECIVDKSIGVLSAEYQEGLEIPSFPSINTFGTCTEVSSWIGSLEEDE